MQSYTEIPDTDTLTASRAKVLDNDKTVMSCSSGTAFPTTNLQNGMLCHRTDLGTLYILISQGPSVWREIATGVPVPVYSGGTGFTSYTVGDITFASGATALSKLADVAAGDVLLSGGVGAAPAYGKVGLTTHVSGILPVANGGTGSATTGSGVTSVSGTAPVVSSGGNTPAISMAAATTSVPGYLTAADWNTFNGKQAALGFTPYNATNPSGYITSAGITTSAVLNATAGLTAGDVGSYMFGYAWNSGTVTYAFGSTLAGSGLRPVGISDVPALEAAATSPSGTWRCCGYSVNVASNRNSASLWVRIS